MRLNDRLLPEAGSSGARALGLTILAFQLGTAAIAILGFSLLMTFFRYEFAVGGGDAGAYRFDRWSGEATVCLPKDKNPLRLSCSGEMADFMVGLPKQ